MLTRMILTAVAAALISTEASAQYRPAPVGSGPVLRPVIVPQPYLPNPSGYYPPGYTPPGSYLPPSYYPTRDRIDCGTPVPRKDLEKYVERVVKSQLGHCVRDVDVDIDWKRSRVEVDVELRHRGAYREVSSLLHSLPELRGFHICIEVDD